MLRATLCALLVVAATPLGAQEQKQRACLDLVSAPNCRWPLDGAAELLAEQRNVLNRQRLWQ